MSRVYRLGPPLQGLHPLLDMVEDHKRLTITSRAWLSTAAKKDPRVPFTTAVPRAKTDQHDAMVHALRHTPWALVISWIPLILDHPGAWIQRLLSWLSYTGLYVIKKRGGGYS